MSVPSVLSGQGGNWRMQEEKYRRVRLCRLCESPIGSRYVKVHLRRQMDKLRRWWKAHLDTEFTKGTCTVCSFCVWDLRFADEHSKEKEPSNQKWWPPHYRNLQPKSLMSNYYKYYFEELVKPCYVKIAPIAPILEKKLRRDAHRCVYCSRIFSTFNLLANHLSYHHRGQVIRCRFALCKRFFLTEGEKLEHMKTEHPPKSFFKCLYCGEVSTDKYKHKYHISFRHKDQVIRCKYQFCKLMFKTEEERDQHFEEEHNFGEYFCCFCNRYFENPAAQRNHMKRFHKEALKCNSNKMCTNYFKTEEDRQNHILEKHPTDESVKCVYCEKTFLEAKKIVYHIQKEHIDIAIKCKFQLCGTFFKTEEERQKHKEEVHEKYQFFCIYCDKTILLKRENFIYHFQSKHSEEEIIRCDARLCVTYFKTEEEKLAHTIEVHQNLDKNTICIYCNKYFTKISVLAHIGKKHADISIKCNYLQNFCATYFNTLEEREKHIKEVHEAEKIQEPFPCLYCDRISASLNTFVSHVKRKHSDVSIKCPFRRCCQYFKSKEDLEKHFEQKPKHRRQKITRPKRSFTCFLCPKVFRTKAGLDSHTQIIHEGIRDKCPHCQKEILSKKHIKSVFCQICKSKFLCPNLLKSHSLSCKPDRGCPVCAKIFKSDYHLVRHCKRKHTAHIQQWRGLKYKSLGFKCNKCFVYFKTKSSITEHIVKNHTVGNFNCHLCKMKFAKKHLLQRHIVKKHV